MKAPVILVTIILWTCCFRIGALSVETLKNIYPLKLSIYSRVSYNLKPPCGGYGCERVNMIVII